VAGGKSVKKRKLNKPHGHYCYVCGEHRANENFSGRGHAKHICKKCQSLPIAKRNEMIALRKEDDFRPPQRKHKSNRVVEAKTPILFSELDDKLKAESIIQLDEMIGYIIADSGYIPSAKDRDMIFKALCENISESLNQSEPAPFEPVKEYYDPRIGFPSETGFDERVTMIEEILGAESEGFDPYAEPEEPESVPFKELKADEALITVFDKIVASIVAEYKADGIKLPAYEDTLIIAETERLKIRRFHRSDFDALFFIMKKTEVMYAWEHGFSRSETRKWLNRQLTRYHKDGYGYFAVIAKDSGKLIGQAGLINSELHDEPIVEIGYIFDDSVWGHGYALEAVRACTDLAITRFDIDKLYATIRPENEASVKVALKLGMQRIGQYIKTYQDKEMPHDIYMLEKKMF